MRNPQTILRQLATIPPITIPNPQKNLLRHNLQSLPSKTIHPQKPNLKNPNPPKNVRL